MSWFKKKEQPKENNQTNAEVILNELTDLNKRMGRMENELAKTNQKIMRINITKNISDDDFKIATQISGNIGGLNVPLDEICAIITVYKELWNKSEYGMDTTPTEIKKYNCSLCAREVKDGDYYKKGNKKYCLTHLEDDYKKTAKIIKQSKKLRGVENAENSNFI